MDFCSSTRRMPSTEVSYISRIHWLRERVSTLRKPPTRVCLPAFAIACAPDEPLFQQVLIQRIPTGAKRNGALHKLSGFLQTTKHVRKLT